LAGVKGTADNLKEAISGETHEFKEMYPEMIGHAQEEKLKAAELTFNFANEVEKVHAALYQHALDNLEDLKEADYYVCSVCGYTCENEPPDKCPVCNAKASAFFKVD
jgi:rubrerythrin